jgi:hypothetical protein
MNINFAVGDVNQYLLLLQNSSSVAVQNANVRYTVGDCGHLAYVHSGNLTLMGVSIAKQAFTRPLIYVSPEERTMVVLEGVIVNNSSFEGEMSGSVVHYNYSSAKVKVWIYLKTDIHSRQFVFLKILTLCIIFSLEL